MAEITIADASPRVQYSVGSSTTGPWSIPWPYWENDDIKVYFDATLKTITTHYTISGTAVDDGFSGGNVTAAAAQTNITVTIVRDVAVARTTDHSPGLFNIATLNSELDKLTAMAQQLETDLTRVPKLLATDAAATSMSLPAQTATATPLLWSTAGFTSGSATQWLGTDGTVSLPFFSFTSDPNTGIYRIGSDNLGIAVGGAKIVDINGSGFNGILGGTTPADASATTLSSSGLATLSSLSVTTTAAITGVATFGGNVVSDTDSTDSLGTTGVRWLKLWVDSIQTTANVDVAGNLTVTGNLTINGTTVTNDATNTEIKDPLIELNSGASSNANDLGFIFERGSTGNNGFFGWDESGDHFVAATTTATGASTGDISYSLADLKVAAVSATSGTLAGLTSLAMSAGATLTAGFLDEDTLSSNSAVAGVTQQSVKAYVDAAIKAPGIQMTWEANTADSDQGAGKIWANNSTLSSASILYIDDVDKAGVSINAFVDTLDDPTATNSALIYIAEAGSGSAGVVFAVSGGVVSASTYSKITVSHVATIGTLSDADVVGMVIAYSGDNGSINNVADDSSPQAGGDFDMNGHQMQWSQGADVQCANALPLLTDGNYFDIVTGVDTVTSINATGGIGTLVKVHCDVAILWTHHSANLIIPGAANYQSAAGDELEFLEYAAGKYRCTGYALASGGSMVAAGGGGMYEFVVAMLAEEDTSDTSQTTTNGMGTGITRSLAAGEEIVIEIGEIEVESTDGAHTYFEWGLYDGTTFYSGVPLLNGGTSFNQLPEARNNTQAENVHSGNLFTMTNNASNGIIARVYGQKALDLSTSEKTWKLATKKISGAGVKINGSSATAVWSIGVRKEVAP